MTAKIVAGNVLIGLPLLTIAQAVSANPGIESKLKRSLVTPNPAIGETPSQTSANYPNPSIFSCVPYNCLLLVLAENLRATKQVQTPANSDTENKTPSQSEVKPWSEAQENRKSLVKAVNGQFNIRLMNTNTEVTYELVGHTNQRQLTGKTNFLLQDLAMPVTVTVLREDGGLVRITPKSAAPGILELRLDEALNLD